MRLTQGIHRAVQLHAAHPALVGEGVHWSWARFADRVARLAGVLQALGVEPGDRIAILAPNTPAHVEAYFGTLWAGAVMVPVNTRWALPEKVHCLTDAGARVLIVDATYAGEIPAIRTACPALQSILAVGLANVAGHSVGAGFADWFDYESALAAATPVPDANRSGEDLAALFYTGGTTGRSKGVMLSHNNFIANSMNALVNLGIRGDSVHLHVSPLFHVAGGSRVFTTTVAGGTHAMLARFEPEAFLRAIEAHRVTITVVVPTMLNALLQYPHFDRFDLSSLKLLTYGASPMPEELLRRPCSGFPAWNSCSPTA